jgi:hypothetical protein
MSDPRTPGEPVEEPGSVDDVVGQANEGLADAEEARRDAARTDATADETVVDAEPARDETVEGAAASDETPWYERDDVPMDDDAGPEIVQPAAAEPEPVVAEPVVADEPVATDQPETVVAEPVVAEEPVVVTEAAGTAPADQTEVIAPTAVAPAATATAYSQQPQPIFVQAPEPPRPRGNRAAAGAIGLLAALCFAVLYLATALVVNLVTGAVTASDTVSWLVGALATWALWVPVAVFFLAFWLLGAIINRGRWGLWVVFGLLVGLAAYGGHILGQLFQAPFWAVTATQGREVVESQLWVPLAFAAFIFGRELTIWFGAWVSARGRRVS